MDQLLADKAYDADSLIQQAESTESRIVIPARKNRNKMRFQDKHAYKERHLVEFFSQN